MFVAIASTLANRVDCACSIVNTRENLDMPNPLLSINHESKSFKNTCLLLLCHPHCTAVLISW